MPPKAGASVGRPEEAMLDGHLFRGGALPMPGSRAASEAATQAFHLAAGFRAAATACGLKPSGNPDLGLVWSDGPCSAAGVFTTNRVQAAPVTVCRETLATAASRVRGVVFNSGCANAVTGDRGLVDARRMRAIWGHAIGARE